MPSVSVFPTIGEEKNEEKVYAWDTPQGSEEWKKSEQTFHGESILNVLLASFLWPSRHPSQRGGIIISRRGNRCER